MDRIVAEEAFAAHLDRLWSKACVVGDSEKAQVLQILVDKQRRQTRDLRGRIAVLSQRYSGTYHVNF
ncbi:hypothetical protein [Methylobacterium brachythecii]|nr:hypothetical protein [Methylobacterium brachythecii]MBB3905282.1 hypothetical protein [Methylobacterium brachythecii]